MFCTHSRTLVAADGFGLAARLHSPAPPARGAVLVAPAMGVPQSFYAPFAAWLAGEGFATITFDYRGMGESRPKRLRGFPADVLTWARHDAGRALEEATAHANGGSVYWVGHSLGGQILPFVPGHERVRRMVTVGTGSGYWRENAPRLKRTVWALWFLAVPIALPLFGYFPGRRFGMVGDLPRGVMAQWRRWCLDRDYCVGVEPGARELFAAVRTPITSISFTDDEFMSERNVDSIHAFFAGAERRRRRFAPADVGERAVGHFGPFRRQFAESIWRRIVLPELD